MSPGAAPHDRPMPFPTTFHATALEGDTITVSAGKIGYQICCKPEDLIALVGAQVADVV